MSLISVVLIFLSSFLFSFFPTERRYVACTLRAYSRLWRNREILDSVSFLFTGAIAAAFPASFFEKFARFAPSYSKILLFDEIARPASHARNFGGGFLAAVSINLAIRSPSFLCRLPGNSFESWKLSNRVFGRAS